MEEAVNCINPYKDVRCEYIQRKIRGILGEVLCRLCLAGAIISDFNESNLSEMVGHEVRLQLLEK